MFVQDPALIDPATVCLRLIRSALSQICPYLSSSVSSAARLQPRRASGRRGQALLALPQDRPIGLRRGGHHPLPLRRPLPALRHRPLYLPAEVGRTARHPNSPRSIPLPQLQFLEVKQRDNTRPSWKFLFGSGCSL